VVAIALQVGGDAASRGFRAMSHRELEFGRMLVLGEIGNAFSKVPPKSGVGPFSACAGRPPGFRFHGEVASSWLKPGRFFWTRFHSWLRRQR